MVKTDRIELPGSTKPSRLIFYCLVFILLLRFVMIGLMGPMPQDAYYYMYSQHLSLSYFDHPPMIAYILRLFTVVFGKNVFALKLADTVVTLLTLYFFYRLALRFQSRDSARKSVLLLFSTLLISIISLVTIPDGPLLLFWTISLLSLHGAIFREEKISWIWAGLWMGLAFDSKYSAIFLPIGLLIFLVLSNKYRKLLLSPWLWLSALLFLVIVSPVFIWNMQHHFVSFLFQSSGRTSQLKGIHIYWKYFLGTIGHEMILLLPVLFISLVWFLIRALRKNGLGFNKISGERLFLLCFFIPVFGGFFFVSFFTWVKLNWIMPAYISGIIWVADYIGRKWTKIQVWSSVALHLLIAIEIIFYVVPVKSDDTWLGWKTLATKVETLRIDDPASFVFSADENKTSAILNFYLGGNVYAENIIGQPALQFDYIGTDLKSLAGKNAFFINSSPGFKNELRENDFPAVLHDYFDSVIELDPIIVRKNGRDVRKFLVYYCRNYHPK